MQLKHILSVLMMSSIGFFLYSCQAHDNFPGREYMPDMTHSQAYELYVPSRVVMVDGEEVQLSKDGKAAFKPVANTIPRGHIPYHLPDTPEGYEMAGSSLSNPYNSNVEAVLEDGKKHYDIYCAVCHGAKGKGDGSVVESGAYPPPPTYFIDRLLEMPEGQMFHSVHYGKNLMGSYAAQLTKEERWKVIAYIKDMQADYITGNSNLTKEQASNLIIGHNSFSYKRYIDNKEEMTTNGMTISDQEVENLESTASDNLGQPSEDH